MTEACVSGHCTALLVLLVGLRACGVAPAAVPRPPAAAAARTQLGAVHQSLPEDVPRTSPDALPRATSGRSVFSSDSDPARDRRSAASSASAGQRLGGGRRATRNIAVRNIATRNIAVAPPRPSLAGGRRARRSGTGLDRAPHREWPPAYRAAATDYVPFNSLTLLRLRRPQGQDARLQWPYFAAEPGGEVQTAGGPLHQYFVTATIPAATTPEPAAVSGHPQAQAEMVAPAVVSGIAQAEPEVAHGSMASEAILARYHNGEMTPESVTPWLVLEHLEAKMDVTSRPDISGSTAQVATPSEVRGAQEIAASKATSAPTLAGTTAVAGLAEDRKAAPLALDSGAVAIVISEKTAIVGEDGPLTNGANMLGTPDVFSGTTVGYRNATGGNQSNTAGYQDTADYQDTTRDHQGTTADPLSTTAAYQATTAGYQGITDYQGTTVERDISQPQKSSSGVKTSSANTVTWSEKPLGDVASSTASGAANALSNDTIALQGLSVSGATSSSVGTGSDQESPAGTHSDITSSSAREDNDVTTSPTETDSFTRPSAVDTVAASSADNITIASHENVITSSDNESGDVTESSGEAMHDVNSSPVWIAGDIDISSGKTDNGVTLSTEAVANVTLFLENESSSATEQQERTSRLVWTPTLETFAPTSAPVWTDAVQQSEVIWVKTTVAGTRLGLKDVTHREPLSNGEHVASPGDLARPTTTSTGEERPERVPTTHETLAMGEPTATSLHDNDGRPTAMTTLGDEKLVIGTTSNISGPAGHQDVLRGNVTDEPEATKETVSLSQLEFVREGSSTPNVDLDRVDSSSARQNATTFTTGQQDITLRDTTSLSMTSDSNRSDATINETAPTTTHQPATFTAFPVRVDSSTQQQPLPSVQPANEPMSQSETRGPPPTRTTESPRQPDPGATQTSPRYMSHTARPLQLIESLDEMHDYADYYYDELALGEDDEKHAGNLPQRPTLQTHAWPYTHPYNSVQVSSAAQHVQDQRPLFVTLPGPETQLLGTVERLEPPEREPKPTTEYADTSFVSHQAQDNAEHDGPSALSHHVEDEPIFPVGINPYFEFDSDADYEEYDYYYDSDFLENSNENYQQDIPDTTPSPLSYTYTQLIGYSSKTTTPPPDIKTEPIAATFTKPFQYSFGTTKSPQSSSSIAKTTTSPPSTGIYSISLPFPVQSLASLERKTTSPAFDSADAEIHVAPTAASVSKAPDTETRETTRSLSYSRQTNPYDMPAELLALLTGSPKYTTPGIFNFPRTTTSGLSNPAIHTTLQLPGPVSLTAPGSTVLPSRTGAGVSGAPVLTVLPSESVTKPDRYGGIIETDWSYNSDPYPFQDVVGGGHPEWVATHSPVSSHYSHHESYQNHYQQSEQHQHQQEHRPATVVDGSVNSSGFSSRHPLLSDSISSLVGGASTFFLQAIKKQGQTSYSDAGLHVRPSAAVTVPLATYSTPDGYQEASTTTPHRNPATALHRVPTGSSTSVHGSMRPTRAPTTPIFHYGTTRPQRPTGSWSVHSAVFDSVPPRPTIPGLFNSRPPAPESTPQAFTLVSSPDEPSNSPVTLRPLSCVTTGSKTVCAPKPGTGDQPARPQPTIVSRPELATPPPDTFVPGAARPYLILLDKPFSGENVQLEDEETLELPQPITGQPVSGPGLITAGGATVHFQTLTPQTVAPPLDQSWVSSLPQAGVDSAHSTHGPEHGVQVASHGLTVHSVYSGPMTVSEHPSASPGHQPASTMLNTYQPQVTTAMSQPEQPSTSVTIPMPPQEPHHHSYSAGPPTDQTRLPPSFSYSISTGGTNSAADTTKPAHPVVASHVGSHSESTVHLSSDREPTEQHSYAVVNVWKKVSGELKLVGQHLVPVDQVLGIELGSGDVLSANRLPSHIISQLADSLNLHGLQKEPEPTPSSHTTTTATPPSVTTSSYESYDDGTNEGRPVVPQPTESSYISYDDGTNEGRPVVPQPTESSYISYVTAPQEETEHSSGVQTDYRAPETPGSVAGSRPASGQHAAPHPTLHPHFFAHTRPPSTSTTISDTNYYDNLLFKFTSKPGASIERTTTSTPWVNNRPPAQDEFSPFQHFQLVLQQQHQQQRPQQQQQPHQHPADVAIPIEGPTESSYISYDRPWLSSSTPPPLAPPDGLSVNLNNRESRPPSPVILNLLQEILPAQWSAGRPQQEVTAAITSASMSMLPPQAVQWLDQLKIEPARGNLTLLSLFGGQQEGSLRINGASINVTKGTLGVQVNQLNVSETRGGDQLTTPLFSLEDEAPFPWPTGPGLAVSGFMNLLWPNRSTTTRSMSNNTLDRDDDGEHTGPTPNRTVFDGVNNPDLNGAASWSLQMSGRPSDRLALLPEELKIKQASTPAPHPAYSRPHLELHPVSGSRPINLKPFLHSHRSPQSQESVALAHTERPHADSAGGHQQYDYHAGRPGGSPSPPAPPAASGASDLHSSSLKSASQLALTKLPPKTDMAASGSTLWPASPTGGVSQSMLQKLGDRLGIDNPQLLAAIVLSVLPTMALAVPVLGRRRRGLRTPLDTPEDSLPDRLQHILQDDVLSDLLASGGHQLAGGRLQGTSDAMETFVQPSADNRLRLSPSSGRSGGRIQLDSLQLLSLGVQAELRDRYPAMFAQFQRFGEKIRAELGKADLQRHRTHTAQQEPTRLEVSEDWKDDYQAGKVVDVGRHGDKLVRWLLRVLSVPAGYSNALRQELLGTGRPAEPSRGR